MRPPNLFERIVEWLRHTWCTLFGHDWVHNKGDDVEWCERCGAEKKMKYYKLDEKGNLREVGPDHDEREAVLRSILDRKREQLEKFAELLDDYLTTKHVANMLAYDKRQVQTSLDKLFAYVGELIEGSLNWNEGVPTDGRFVWVCFRHGGEFYHDTDKWNPETKEWKLHNDKEILGWCDIPPYGLVKEQGNEGD